MDNFENSIRHKLDDAELTPPDNMWSKIEPELSPEKKRRGMIWLAWLLPFCLIGGGTIIYLVTPNSSKTLISLEPSNHSQVAQPTMGITPPSKLDFSDKPSNGYNVINNNNNRLIGGVPNFPVSPDLIPSFSYYTDVVNLYNIKSVYFNTFLKSEVSNYKLKSYQVPQVLVPNHINEPKSRIEKPCNFVIEAVNNIYKSDRSLIASPNANADQKNYVKVRNSIEFGKLNWSGGIAVKYCIGRHFLIGTGIRFTNYSEDLIYNKRDVNIAFEAPPIGIDAVVKKKYPYTFTKQTDSIYAGQNYYGGTNSYFFTEVPITFGIYKYGKKFNYYLEPAISYCRITFIKTNLLDLDHVGFTTVNQTDGYQGVSHIFNASMRMGVGKNITKSFSFNAGIYGSRAITPLINYGYAKQLPYTYGITLGFEKRL